MLDATDTTSNAIATATATATATNTTTTTTHLLEELVLGGEMQNHLLVALLSLRARLRARDKNGNNQKER